MLFLLHFLGGSGREWAEVAARLGPGVDCRPLDLPGFGDAAATQAYSVAEMADHVATAVRAAAPGPWLMAGHSMGAKVAACLARRAEQGEAGLEGLAGLILLAGSPPAPEPMAAERRQDMLGWFRGTETERRAQAEGYVAANAGTLPASARALAVQDVLRAVPAAWRAWLQGGSREDWSARVGVLRTPALILAGEADADLGEAAQRRLMAPHFATARIAVVAGAKHLLPLEAPEEVAGLFLGFLRGLPAPVPPAFLSLLQGEHTAARLRDSLLARAAPEDPDSRPASMDAACFAVLRAVVDRVLPQPEFGRVDIAARLDHALAEGVGDGWRYAGMPPDAEAFRAALRTLDAACTGGSFVAQDGTMQDATLRRVAEGQLGSAGEAHLDAPRMALWFEDLRAMASRLYVAHPATLARMGYGGVAAGGDAPVRTGFTRLGIGARDSWEPDAAPRA
jgi:pimeloyl-ACP methyl ester carboxylesterase